MNEITIDLENLQLKTFTEQDVLDYCSINNINNLNIIELNLYYNELTDISGIKLFKNLKRLYLSYNKLTDLSVLKDLKNLKTLWIANNKITDISVLKYLKELRFSDIRYLLLESNQIKYINSCKNLKTLYCREGFKDMNILNQLNKNIKTYK